MKHKTLWLVVVWLALLVVALGLQAVLPLGLPLAPIVNLAGVISLSYVGVDKAKNIVTAAKSPAGQFGFDYVPPMQDKHLWIVIVWLVVLAEAFVIQAIVKASFPDAGITIPVLEVVTFAGILSAAYVGLDKGTKLASVAGAAGAGGTDVASPPEATTTPDAQPASAGGGS